MQDELDTLRCTLLELLDVLTPDLDARIEPYQGSRYLAVLMMNDDGRGEGTFERVITTREADVLVRAGKVRDARAQGIGTV